MTKVVLHFGVEDRLYDGTDVTTGKVATILESKYGVMRAFFEMRKERIADEIGQALLNPEVDKPEYTEACQEIESMFRDALTRKIFDGVIPGVPTKASLTGQTSRKKKKKYKGPRPSFVDTGQYQTDFRVWEKE